jgi:hypothetical protein
MSANNKSLSDLILENQLLRDKLAELETNSPNKVAESSNKALVTEAQ